LLNKAYLRSVNLSLAQVLSIIAANNKLHLS
jgi:hypothetical protein